MNTLNQAVEGLNRIATAHNQINSFGFGDIWEFNTSGTTNMPSMWVELVSSERIRPSTTHTFDIYIMDKVLNGETDETDRLSDCFLIAEDVISEMGHASWTWFFEENVKIDHFTEKTDEFLTGVKFTVKIKINKPSDRCAIPEGTITRI